MKISNLIRRSSCILRQYFSYPQKPDSNMEFEDIKLMLGRLLVNQQLSTPLTDISDAEFKVFSQFGDDGIIQYLTRHVQIRNKRFIEFGVGDYMESNTRFLLMNNNWSGFIMDGSKEFMEKVRNRPWFWQYDLVCRDAFITRENINGLINETGMKDIGLLHVDLDGNDYWIFKELDLSDISPAIIILEYNSLFGKERAITVPYSPDFSRFNHHFSGLYWGASLKSLVLLANSKGYSFVGSNTAGNNAYFIRNDLVPKQIKVKTTEEAHVTALYRESRDKHGQLSFLRDSQRIDLIRGLRVINVETNQEELF